MKNNLLIIVISLALSACGGSNSNDSIRSDIDYIPNKLDVLSSQVQLLALYRTIRYEFDKNGIGCGSSIALSESSSGDFYRVDSGEPLLNYVLVTDIQYLADCTLKGVVVIKDIDSSGLKKATIFFSGDAIQYIQRDTTAGYEIQGNASLYQLELDYKHLFYY